MRLRGREGGREREVGGYFDDVLILHEKWLMKKRHFSSLLGAPGARGSPAVRDVVVENTLFVDNYRAVFDCDKVLGTNRFSYLFRLNESSNNTFRKVRGTLPTTALMPPSPSAHLVRSRRKLCKLRSERVREERRSSC